MDTKLLTEAAFRATFTAPMHQVPAEEGAVDVGPYVAAVPAELRDGLDLVDGQVRQVWRDAYERYDHVLLALGRCNTYLVVVVDLKQRCIHGHHVLDLGAAEGVT